MHDLRRQALESGKTVSRKARSKQPSVKGSKDNSPAASRNGSRVASRNPSDDEDDFSDSTNFSTNSIDDMLESCELEAPVETWTQNLNDRMEQIIDRKRSSAGGREESLNGLAHLLMAHFAQPEIRPKINELLSGILKSIKAGQTEKETILALKALALLLITEPSDTIYDAVTQPIKSVVHDSEYPAEKIAAIHALGVAVFYGGASEDETQDILSFLLEIIESDGVSIAAEDNADVVTAALEEWGFLATSLDDFEETTEEPMEAFVEQLDSFHVGVQIAAGENIALLYEKSYTELEDDEELEDQGSDAEETGDPDVPVKVKRYSVYRQENQLKHTLEELAKASSRRMSKKDRKSLHSNFADILHSVEHPARGPRYSTAIDQETGKHYGSRLTVGVGGKSKLAIKSWEQLHRLRALKRILQGGFLVHYADNRVVFDTLPVMIQD